MDNQEWEKGFYGNLPGPPGCEDAMMGSLSSHR